MSPGVVKLTKRHEPHGRHSRFRALLSGKTCQKMEQGLALITVAQIVAAEDLKKSVQGVIQKRIVNGSLPCLQGEVGVG